MTQPPRRYIPGVHSIFNQDTQVLPVLSPPVRTGQTRVLPKVKDSQLERRVGQLEEQLVGMRQEVRLTRDFADRALLAMVVSIFCAFVCLCVLISVFFLGG